MGKIIHLTYGGRVKVVFDETPHIYTVDEERKPSATTVTGVIDKPALKHWAANQAGAYIRKNLKPGHVDEVDIEDLATEAASAWKKFQKKKALIGTSAHDYIEQHIRAQLGERAAPTSLGTLHKSTIRSVEGFYEWEKMHTPEYKFAERVLYSERLGVAGTADIGCLIDGVPTVIDLKTGKGVYAEFTLQIEFYRQALGEEFPEDWDIDNSERAILHIPATGKWKYYDELGLHDLSGTTQNEDWEAFVGALGIWKWKDKNPKTWKYKKP
jgi:hypothetical protein